MSEITLQRIISMESEATETDGGQYILTDSNSGTKKMNVGALMANDAPTFSSSTAYSAGDIVVYNTKLYKFSADHSAGAWVGTDAEQITLGAKISDVKSDLELLEQNLTDVINPEATSLLANSFLKIYVKSDGSYVGSNSWLSYYEYVDENAIKYEFKGYTNTVGFYAIAFYDNRTFTNANFISGIQYTETGANNFVLEKADIPSNAKLILFITRTASATDQTIYKYTSGLENTLEYLTNGVNDIPFVKQSFNQIARLGWQPYKSDTPPEQSIDSYKLAYKNGCKIMLCDVRVTSDGNFVLWHDSTLNNTVKHTDGTDLSSSELETTIADSTLAELNAYDYGLYKGSEYAGMKIPMLNDFLNWCGIVNCSPMLEIKVYLTEAQCIEISNMCKMYGLGETVIIDEYTTAINNTMQTWIDNLPNATISIIGGSAIDLVIPKLQQILQAGLNALIVLSSSSQLVAIQDDQGNIDYEKVRTVTDIGADFVYTEIQTTTELESFYNDGYLSIFRYVSSGQVNINKWINNNLL